MITLIALAAAVAATIAGYRQSRSFVRGRLRFVDAVQKPTAPFIAGAAATAVALPLVAILPVVGAGTALLFGAAVGTGVSHGARDVRTLGGGAS
ncbi:MAG TPA: hypothetical protein VFS05_08445 [Gemmatimonadaceae bacterium]|nr:hypothetical protein [Gemmatimonadaceae bacterium]